MVDEDYPRDLVRTGAQGLVRFRLTVDKEGAPTKCDLASTTKPEGFGSVVCGALLQRARFKPALDAQGEPIKSYFTGVVRFQMER